MEKANILINTVAGVAIMLTVAGWGVMSGRAQGTPEEIADAQGALHVPQNYRSTYQILGSWAVAADQGPGSKEIHTVYASPGVAQSYRKDGVFADGTVLVKEVFEAATEPMTTGIVSRPGKLKGWFVMLKDSNNHHPGNKLWGDGWDWSWFDADNPSRTTSTDYQTDCQSCHAPAQSTDWVYVDGYPPLKR
ncbi:MULTISPECIES: cytochrome P460 family protein [unclassified Bradyrhizobium]|uniref:cytochrome P460 family protein n=1 Tax=unclassified Bradyrhizobium TaxID=2631580 RepID=UPI001FF729F8|nr:MULTISPECIES: cytochrome P460 family protein [unclassified Bradyrhizobium]